MKDGDENISQSKICPFGSGRRGGKERERDIKGNMLALSEWLEEGEKGVPGNEEEVWRDEMER